MIKITLTTEQKEQLRQDGSLEICDAKGSRLATIHWEDTTEFLDDVKKQMAQSRDRPKVSGRKVLEQLNALENEWQRTGGFDPDYAIRFVDKLRSEDQG